MFRLYRDMKIMEYGVRKTHKREQVKWPKEEQTYGISLFDAMKPDKPRQKKKHSQLKIG